MHTPAVVVKKGGFLAALASGIFGLLIIGVLCGTGLAAYWSHIADKHLSGALGAGQSVLANLPKLRENLPPVLADALRDRRAPEYREKITVAGRLSESRRHGNLQRAVIEVTNNGKETISLMAVNISVNGRDKTPVDSFVAYVATPLALEDDAWRGPILPGSTRQVVRWVDAEDSPQDVMVEVAELRLADSGSAAATQVARADDD